MAVPKTEPKLLFFKFQNDRLVWSWIKFLVLSLLLDCSSQLVVSNSLVNSLPGFQGPLPFELETGYVGVDESEDVQLFYYFVKSESNPKEDPLVLWLSGGPGCSSISGLIYEIGPVLIFKATQKDGSLAELVLNPYSWSHAASIIYLDLPVGTGFSYARTSLASYSTDLQACDQAYEFLRKWLMDHPEFLLNSFYVAGDSFAGIPVPIIVQLISNGNEAGVEPFIDLKGYLLGNPVTYSAVEGNYRIPFGHGMGLISDELFESLQRNCKGEYFNVDPNNKECLEDVEAYTQVTNGINSPHILEPFCGYASPKPWDSFSKRRSLDVTDKELVASESSPCASSRIDGYRLSPSWLNDDGVREALHIRKGSTGEWVRCNDGLPYNRTVEESFQYHVNLSTKGFKSLIYSGDHDMFVPFLGTQAWIRSLKYSIVDDWRSWVVQGQVAGEEGTQLQSSNLLNVIPCSKDGSLTNLCNLFGATANSESESSQFTGNIRQHYKGQV